MRLQTRKSKLTSNQQDGHIWKSRVRGYEVDLQGIVNNACYMNYLDQARVEALFDKEVNWEALQQDGYSIVLIDSHLKWKASLKCNDLFFVHTSFEQASKLRINCIQSIISEDEKIILESASIVTCVNTETKKPCMPQKLKVICLG